MSQLKVELTAYAWEKMRHYVDGCKGEVSGLGKIEVGEDGQLIITDCTIFEQKVSSAHSNIETEALAKFQVEMIQKGEDLGKWKLWWHSHATMAVFWSGTDTGTIDTSTEFEYMVSLVTNHNHDIKCRVDLFRPLRMTEDDVDVYIQESEDAELKAQCDAEIKAKVTEPPVTKYTKHVGYKPSPIYPRANVFDDDDWNYHYPLTKSKGQATLPYASDLDIPDDAQAIEAYYDTKEELEQEVLDAEDEGTRAVAVQLLADHKKQGELLGLEN